MFRGALLALFLGACGGQGTDTNTTPVPLASAAASTSASPVIASSTAVATASASAQPASSSAVPVVSASASASASVSAPETFLGTVKIKAITAAWAANSDKVGDRMLPGFRRCYSQALEKDPKAAGDLRIAVNTGPNGEVISTKLVPGSKLPADTQACMAARVKSAMFAPPPSAQGFVKVSIHCEP